MADPSLLDYLAGTRKPFSLEFVSGSGGLNAEIAPLLPFEIINDTSALTRIIRARVVSDAGSGVKQVFLLLSRDDYPLAGVHLNPLNNLDIESAWQNAFQNHLKCGSLIALSAQGDEQGGLEPFRSIFYCTRAKAFFHPPCPQCGKELELFRDDRLLGEAGLKPYSTSLARYLACPVCGLKEGGRAFYALTKDAADPACVKSPAELIMGFAGLKNADLPCMGCAENTACYRDRQALSLITPIAFYPFYLLMFEAASLNACDYLALVSGAPFEEIEQALAARRQFARKGLVSLIKSRADSPLLFTGDVREFLEILYLKLCFLREVAGYVVSGERRFAYPVFGPSLDRLWVQLPEQGSLLPAFWTFKSVLMDMEPEISGVLPSLGADYAAHCMGMLWFHALLSNRSQDVRAINEGIAKVLKGKQVESDMPVFRPDNIFWEPRPAPVKWKGLWEKALDIGRALLVDAGKPGFESDGLWQACGELTDEIKKELFLAAPAASLNTEVSGERRPDDAQIGIILRQIRSKWAQGQAVTLLDEKVEKPEPADMTLRPQPVSAPDDGEATIIITPAEPPVQEEAKDEYSQTVILAAGPQQQGTPPAQDEDFSTETVIMRHPDASSAALVPTKEPVDMDKTVVMNPSPVEPVTKAKEGPLRKPAESELEETLIMGSAKRSTPASGEKKHATTDDAMEETVILKPEKK